jgi:hypothetical protein
VDPPVPVVVELGLDGFLPELSFDAKVGAYPVIGRLVGLDPAMTEVTVTLSGDARVTSTRDSVCSVVSEVPGATTLRCLPAGSSSVELMMDLEAPPGKVRIDVAVPEGFKDDDADGLSPNFHDVTLLEVPVAEPFAYVDGPFATLVKANEYAVKASVQGIPLDVDSVSFVLPDQQQEFISASVGCTIEEIQLGDRRTVEVMTCPRVGDTTAVSVAFDAKLPAGRGDLVARAGEDEIRSAIADVTPPRE